MIFKVSIDCIDLKIKLPAYQLELRRKVTTSALLPTIVIALDNITMLNKRAKLMGDYTTFYLKRNVKRNLACNLLWRKREIYVWPTHDNFNNIYAK